MCSSPQPYYYCVSFALLQGILLFSPRSRKWTIINLYSGKCPLPLSVDSHTPSPVLCSMAGYPDQPRLLSFGLLVCTICYMHAYAFPPALCTRKGSHSLP